MNDFNYSFILLVISLSFSINSIAQESYSDISKNIKPTFLAGYVVNCNNKRIIPNFSITLHSQGHTLYASVDKKGEYIVEITEDIDLTANLTFRLGNQIVIVENDSIIRQQKNIIAPLVYDDFSFVKFGADSHRTTIFNREN